MSGMMVTVMAVAVAMAVGIAATAAATAVTPAVMTVIAIVTSLLVSILVPTERASSVISMCEQRERNAQMTSSLESRSIFCNLRIK